MVSPDVESGQYLSGFESWDLVEGRLLRFLIEGPLFWLGAIACNGCRTRGRPDVQADPSRLRLARRHACHKIRPNRRG